jgi:methylase of polypeptide subunit release factors
VRGLPTPPRPDAVAAPALRRRLEALGYSEARVVELMEGTDWLTSPSDAGIVDRRLPPEGVFAVAFRLFFLGLDVDALAAEDALTPVSLDSAAAMGLLARDGATVRPRVQLAPVGSLLVASDAGDSLRGPAEFVTGRTPSTLALLAHTVREPVRTALDVGCGNGAQALAAARHAERVVATDVNPRALAFTRFNAALNGLANVEVREGSWFDPVAGERFDLVVANPPFVVSPDSAFLYRDAGLPGDAGSRRLVAGAAEHLEEGGGAHLICNWVHPPGDWAAPLRRWVDGLGCDTSVLRFSSRDARGYALDWNAHLEETDPAEFEAIVERWLEHYRALGIEAIGYGVVILRRRSGAANRFHAVTVPPYPTSEPVS